MRYGHNDEGQVCMTGKAGGGGRSELTKKTAGGNRLSVVSWPEFG